MGLCFDSTRFTVNELYAGLPCASRCHSSQELNKIKEEEEHERKILLSKQIRKETKIKIDNILKRNFLTYEDNVKSKSEFIMVNFTINSSNKKENTVFLRYKDYRRLKRYFEKNLVNINHEIKFFSCDYDQKKVLNDYSLNFDDNVYYNDKLKYFNEIDNSKKITKVEILNFSQGKIKDYKLYKEQLRSRFRFLLAVYETNLSSRCSGLYEAGDCEIPELFKFHNLISKLISNEITREQYDNPDLLYGKYEVSLFQQLWDVLFLYDMRFNHKCKLEYSDTFHSRSIKENEIMITLDEKYNEFRINKLVNIKYLPIIKHIAHRNKYEYITQSDFDNCKENINLGGEAYISIGDRLTRYKLNEDTREFLENTLCDSDIRYAISNLICRIGVKGEGVLEPSDIRIHPSKITGYDGFCYFLLDHPKKSEYIKRDIDYKQYVPKFEIAYAIDIILKRFSTLISKNKLLIKKDEFKNKIIAIEKLLDILEDKFYAILNDKEVLFLTKEAYIEFLKELQINPIRRGDEKKYISLIKKYEKISFNLPFDNKRSDDKILSDLNHYLRGSRKLKSEYLSDNYNIFENPIGHYDRIKKDYEIMKRYEKHSK